MDERDSSLVLKSVRNATLSRELIERLAGPISTFDPAIERFQRAPDEQNRRFLI